MSNLMIFGHNLQAFTLDGRRNVDLTILIHLDRKFFCRKSRSKFITGWLIGSISICSTFGKNNNHGIELLKKITFQSSPVLTRWCIEFHVSLFRNKILWRCNEPHGEKWHKVYSRYFSIFSLILLFPLNSFYSWFLIIHFFHVP